MKPMKTALGIIAFITRFSLPLWVRWHSSTKTKTSPTVWLGWASSSLMKASKSSTSFLPNLWTSEQSSRGLAWPSCVIRSRPLVVRLMASPASLKTPSICLSSSSRSVMMATRALGLFSRIHLASSTMTMLLPLPWVCQMMPPLRWRTCSCAALMPKYWCTRGSFFTPPSNSTKSCINSISRSLRHIFSRYLSSLKRVLSCLVFFPLQEILLLRPDGSVLQTLGIVTRKNELHRAEEARVEFRLLVGQALANAVADGDAAVFQFQHADGDAVHVQHNVRPALVVAAKRDFLGDGEVVFLRFLPVDQVDGFGDLPGLDLYRHAVAQQVVNRLVVAVEAATVVVRFGAQLVDGHADLRGVVAASRQVSGKDFSLNVAVAFAVAPIAEVAIAQFIAEQGDDAVLRGAFGLADVAHINRVRPVRSSCIMPCLSWRALVSLVSSAATSPSMSDSVAAMTTCSS